MRISVILSGRQFRDGGLSEQVSRVLECSGLQADLLELEITESVLMHGDNSSSDNIAALDSIGVRFAIDDIGTGYSSLSYLTRFPIRTLKIARAFIRDVKTDQDDAAIVTAIIAMARSLGLDVVAAGVETAEQLAYLRETGCDQIQGFLISRPLPQHEAAALLARGRRMLARACSPRRVAARALRRSLLVRTLQRQIIRGRLRPRVVGVRHHGDRIDVRDVLAEQQAQIGAH